MRLSIRYKILWVLGLLLLGAVGFYTVLASFIFAEQKTALLYEINHSIASNTAAQIRSSLGQVSDQLKLYAISRLLSAQSDLHLPASALREKHILTMGFFLKTQGGFAPQRLPPDLPTLVTDFASLQPHLQEAVRSQQSFWSRKTQAGSTHYFLASRLDLTMGKTPHTYVTVAEIDGKPFFEILRTANVFESYVMTSKGDVLVHINEKGDASLQSIPDHPLIQARNTPTRQLTGVQSYTFQGTQWYGAFAPVGVADLVFISQADQAEVTSALTTLLQRSLLFGLIVATATFMASILFSKSLTRNLQRLTQVTQAIGGGNLNSHIKVHSGDEVETLAHSFNQMIDALRTSRERIERYNRELEDKVALRTKQLSETNAAIKAVQEKLLQTTQLATVGEVAGRTAHELLNPLTAIISRLERSRLNVQPATGPSTESFPAQLLEILQAWKEDYSRGGVSYLAEALQAPSTVSPGKTLLDEDLDNLQKLGTYWQNQTSLVSGDLDFVKDQAQRIHRIVDRMRELVRSSVKSTVSCQHAIREAVATMSDFLSQNGVSLELEWTAEEDLAFLNRDELIQILTNLLRNSYQAVREGNPAGGTIRIVGTNKDSFLQIDIIDNGSGISPEAQARLFDQGFTTKAPSEGTGLGLAICRRYAHAFGGEVLLAYSEPTRGTCFRITIPLKRREAVA